MSIEKEKPLAGEPERLTEEQAHGEANAMRAKLGVSPETGKIPQRWSEEREPGKEDYDKALQALEDLETLIKTEPTSAKILHAIVDVLRIPVLGTAFVDRIMGYLPNPEPKEVARQRAERGWNEDLQEYFASTRAQLEVLRHQGRKFGTEEAEKE